MADEKLSQGEIARRVGVGVDVVGRWLKEAHRPRGDLAAKLEDKCQIPAGAWWQAPSEADPSAATDASATPIPAKTGTEHG
jgi:transcriptional regulator with XRE-family HTH domain